VTDMQKKTRPSFSQMPVCEDRTIHLQMKSTTSR